MAWKECREGILVVKIEKERKHPNFFFFFEKMRKQICICDVRKSEPGLFNSPGGHHTLSDVVTLWAMSELDEGKCFQEDAVAGSPAWISIHKNNNMSQH